MLKVLITVRIINSYFQTIRYHKKIPINNMFKTLNKYEYNNNNKLGDITTKTNK